MSITQHRIPVENIREFQEIIEGSPKVVALVYASWCPYCVRFLPVFERASMNNEAIREEFFFFQDDQEIMADEYTVDVIPTVLVFENGQLIKRLDGQLGVGLNEKQLTAFLKSV
ncbi:MAG TPA: hypothetical protein DDW50_10720 [Firmicutes bacterium]|jgi:thioredoxin 1|nr:hypothetical protein [Bacillota bacterium]